MNKTKRLLALVLALVMSLTLFACGQKQTDQTDQGQDAQGETTRVFTDSCGREVTVPTDIQKVAVSGPLAQMVVFAIAPDKMVGVANAWDETAENYFDQKYLDLPLLGQLYGGKGAGGRSRRGHRCGRAQEHHGGGPGRPAGTDRHPLCPH